MNADEAPENVTYNKIFDHIVFGKECPEELDIRDVAKLMTATLKSPDGGDYEKFKRAEPLLRDLIDRGVLPASECGLRIAERGFREKTPAGQVISLYPPWAKTLNGEEMGYTICRDDIMKISDRLGKYEIGFKTWISPTQENKTQTKPLSRHLHQEQEILRVIKELGYTPTNLPKDQPGKPGVKAEVRDKLSFTDSVFDKAWGRLSKSKDIVKLKQ